MVKKNKQTAIEKWIKEKNKEDVKNELNPIYSIKIGSPYAEKEMYEDVEQLMIAVGTTFYNKGIEEAKEIVEKEFPHNWLDSILEGIKVPCGCPEIEALCFKIKKRIKDKLNNTGE